MEPNSIGKNNLKSIFCVLLKYFFELFIKANMNFYKYDLMEHFVSEYAMHIHPKFSTSNAYL